MNAVPFRARIEGCAGLCGAIWLVLGSLVLGLNLHNYGPVTLSYVVEVTLLSQFLIPLINERLRTGLDGYQRWNSALGR